MRSYLVSGDTVNANGVDGGDVDGDGLGDVIVASGGNRPSSNLTVSQAAADATLTLCSAIDGSSCRRLEQ